MRVGIVTFHNALSYGAMLQAYALQESIRELGHEAIIIDYIPNGIRWPSWWDRLLTKNLSGYVAKSNYYKFSKVFVGFAKKHLNLSGRFVTERDLKNANANVDAFVCGSDQIWSPRNFATTGEINQAFFLAFADATKRLVAYAPSFGRTPNDSFLEAVKPYLDRMESISVREESAARLLTDKLERPVKCVCDPTVLLGRKGFDSMLSDCDKSISGDYVFCFQLSYCLPRDSQILRRICASIPHLKDVKIASRPLSYKGIGQNVIPTPDDWIRLIRDSRFVVTNSFHGTVFSLLYHRPFVSLGWERKEKNIRMKELLSHVGLVGRLVDTDAIDDGRIEEFTKGNIDWAAVDKKLMEWRELSIAYLARALSEECK